MSSCRIDQQDPYLKALNDRDDQSNQINSGHDQIEDAEAFMESSMSQGLSMAMKIGTGLMGVLSSVMGACCGGCGG
jgi:hypothetical protein